MINLRRIQNFLCRVERNPSLLEASKIDAGNGLAKTARVAFDDLMDDTAVKMGGTLQDLEAGSITGKQALDKMTKDLNRAHKGAYLTGKDRITGKKSILSADDKFYLKRVATEEAKFLKGFVDDVVSKATKAKRRMGASTRLQLYTRSLRASHHNAMVEYSGGGEGSGTTVLISWILGIAEHCEDCLSLAAMSPFTRFSLPAVPGSDTKCGGNCRCHLSYKTIKKPARKSAFPVRPKAARDLWNLPTPPKGLSVPSAEQRIAVENLRTKVNYQRRRIQDLTNLGETDLARAAQSARAAANKELNDFLSREKLWSPPAFSVEDVLNGRVLDDRIVDALFSIGTDGATLAGLPPDLYRTVVKNILDEIPIMDSEIKLTLAGSLK